MTTTKICHPFLAEVSPIVTVLSNFIFIGAKVYWGVNILSTDKSKKIICMLQLWLLRNLVCLNKIFRRTAHCSLQHEIRKFCQCSSSSGRISRPRNSYWGTWWYSFSISLNNLIIMNTLFRIFSFKQETILPSVIWNSLTISSILAGRSAIHWIFPFR
jgi:hypothetical protein